MHTKPPGKQFCLKCPIPGCQSWFDRESKLDEHLRIHNNDLAVCAYCPYRYAQRNKYREHLNMHFEIREFKCDQCDSKFTKIHLLNRHYEKHEGIVYNCLICHTYKAACKRNIEFHLRTKHADIVGKNADWDDLRSHIRTR